MTKDELQFKIQKKFKSLSNFGRIVNIPRYELQLIFSRKQIPALEMKRLLKLIKENDNAATGNALDPEKVKALKTAIDEYGGVYKFCKDNTDFNESQVYQFYNGKMFNTRMGKLVKALFDHFQIE